MKTDFFDGATPQRPRNPIAGQPAEYENPGHARQVSDIDVGALSDRREKVTSRVAAAAEHIERLRRRQEELEQAKRVLEELRRKQDKYEQGRREMIERLSKSIVLLEKREVQAARLSEASSTTRARFGELLSEIQKLNDEAWPEEGFEEELSKALAVIENARLEYSKGTAHIESLGLDKAQGGESGSALADSVPGAATRGIGHWMTIGLGASLPLIVVIVVLFVVYLFLQGLIGLR